MDRVEFVSKVRYLGWLCFQMGAGLPLHDVTDDYAISQERLDSLRVGTQWALAHPNATPEDNHIAWMRTKASQGYVYGDVLDVTNKTHPSMIPFEDLSKVEQDKDVMDLLMVKLADKLYAEIYNDKENNL